MTRIQYSILIMLLRSVQASCRALDMTIATCLTALEQDSEEEPEEAPKPVSVSAGVSAAPPEKEEPPCNHPQSMRLPMAAMGHPTRFHCKQCQETVE